MARLTEKQIESEVKRKGFKIVDMSQYRNLKSKIIVECGKNHMVETTMHNVRKDSFRCPVCHGGEVDLAAFTAEKKGFRTVALDNSTQDVGLAIFDNEKLVYYTLLKFRGAQYENRLLAISEYLKDVIIEQWDPDILVFEDVQFQSNYATYKKLAMLLGILTVTALEYGIDNEIIASSSWRSYYQIGGERRAAKARAIELVKTMYDIDVNDDVAEAILLGKYVSEQIIPSKTLKKAF